MGSPAGRRWGTHETHLRSARVWGKQVLVGRKPGRTQTAVLPLARAGLALLGPSQGPFLPDRSWLAERRGNSGSGVQVRC